MTPTNHAVNLLRKTKMTLDHYYGLCGELCDEVLHEHPEAKILYIQPHPVAGLFPGVLEVWREGSLVEWSYHMVPVVDGLVHDAWFPEDMLPPDEYVKKIFGDVLWNIVD